MDQTAVESKRRRHKKPGHDPGLLVVVTQNVSRFRYGIALKVGIDILDWSFLKRSHKVSLKGSIIMYGVLLLTVFIDLIVAMGVGVFIANILTIERLSNMQSQTVKVISDADDAINLTPEDKSLLDEGNGWILLFYLQLFSALLNTSMNLFHAEA